MRVIKFVMKVAALPMLALLTAVMWVLTFLNAFSSIVFKLFAGVAFLSGVLSYGFGLDPGRECLKTIAIGFTVFMIPVIAETIIIMISTMTQLLFSFIIS